MNAEREARDERQRRLADALCQPVRDAIASGIPLAGRQHYAEEDVEAVIDSLVEALDHLGMSLIDREKAANYLLTHVGGDESQPWQAGHNYAMTEAARLVREGWEDL